MNDTDHIIPLLENARVAFKKNNLSHAYKLYLQIINIAPGNAIAALESGQVCATMGKLDEAENAFDRVIKLEPDYISGHYMKGALNLMRGNYKQAITSLEKTLFLNSNFIDAIKDLGTAFYHLKQYEKAAGKYETYLKHQPDKVSVIYNLGLVRKEQHLHEEAESLFRKALSLSPNVAEIHNSLGHVLNLLHNLPESEEHCRIAIKLNPKLADAHFNLGMLLAATYKLCDAERSFLQALQLNPQHLLAENALAGILSRQGDIQRAEQHYRNAISTNNSAIAYSNLLLGLHYRIHNDRDSIFKEHLLCCTKFGTKNTIQHKSTDEKLDKILRIGYVSGNFRTHSVAYYLDAIFQYTNPDSVEIYCYSDSNRHDAYTDFFQEHAAQWRQIFSSSNTEVAKQIKNDKIDILVDLAGHTDKGYYRLSLFAMKPAPIQVTYLGYPDTTGLDTMDYRLTDRIADPSGSEKWHSESLLYLETGFLCYTPPRDAPAVAHLPAKKNNFITFGSFNSLVKISPETLETWIKILQHVPNSRLLIKSESFSDKEIIDRYRSHLLKNSIDTSRFDLIGWTANTTDHLNLYGNVDIGLDTFPYNGTTTTCEALWMGVPVITLVGNMHCSRVGTSLLTTSGLPQLIASDINEYIDKAVGLACNIQELKRLRESLRDKVANSPLHNGEHFTRQLEACYRDMWYNWCNFPKKNIDNARV